MKTYTIAVLDSTFSAFISFVLAFLIINFYVDRPFSIIFAVCLSVPIFIIAFERIKKNNLLKCEKTRKKKAIDNLVYSLCLLERIKVSELFERAINSLDIKTLKRKHGIFIQDKTIALFPIFSFDGISKTDVVRVFNAISQNQKAYILGEKLSSEVKAFIDRFNAKIEFVDGEKVYDFLEKTGCLPQDKLALNNSRGKKLEFFKKLIRKKHSNKFLIFGLSLILSSWFVPIKMYYIICGCAFLMLSLICRLYGQELKKE